MKKIMLTLLAIAATMNMTAITIDAKAKITVSAGGAETSLLLIESQDLNTGWNNGYCGEIYDLSEFPIALYIEYGSKHYVSFGTKTLTDDAITIGTKTNGSESYTLTISNASSTSEPLVLQFGSKEVPLVNGSYVLTAAEFAAAGKIVVPTPVVPSLCFENNILEIIGYEGQELILTKDEVVIDHITSLEASYIKDLNAYTGRMEFSLNGDSYAIDANPEVTPVNP